MLMLSNHKPKRVLFCTPIFYGAYRKVKYEANKMC